MRILSLIALGLCLATPTSLVLAEKKPVSQRLEDGEAIYRYACARCHDHGEGDAPIIGDASGWSDRSTLWEAVLFEHAEKGYLSMPAGGGDSRLTQYDIDVAAEYMVQTTFPDLPED